MAYSSTAAQQQAAEHWADEHGTLGHEHPIADHLEAAQQSTATSHEAAERRSKLELLRQRHDSNAAEQWQDEQIERMAKRRRVDQGLTDESEPEAEEDEGSEVDDETQAEYVSDDEHLTECFECQKQQVFCSAAGCLELYCKGCADPDTDNHVQDFLLCAAPSCCGKKQYYQEHQDALHQCHCCKKYVCYKQLCSHCEEPACGECLEDGVCQDCQ